MISCCIPGSAWKVLNRQETPAPAWSFANMLFFVLPEHSLPQLADDLVAHDLLRRQPLGNAEVVGELGGDLVDDFLVRQERVMTENGDYVDQRGG